MADLKPAYRTVSKVAAEIELDRLGAKWGKHYPIVLRSWRNKWANLSAYFKYPEYVRKAMYTTKTVEAVHRQLRELTKTKDGFPTENSLLKLLFAGILNASKKRQCQSRTGIWHCRSWRSTSRGAWMIS